MSLEAAISRIDQIEQLQDQIFGSVTDAAATGGVSLSSTAGTTGATNTSAGASPTQATSSASNQTSFAAALAGAQAASSASSADQAAAADPTAAQAAGLQSGTSTQSGLDAQGDFISQNALASSTGTGTTASTASSTPTTTSGLSDPLTSGVIDSLNPVALSSAPATTATATAGVSGAASTAPAAVQAMVAEANSLIGKPYVWGGGHSGWGQQTGYDCSGFVSAVLHAGGYLSSPQDTQTLPSSPGIASGPGQYVTIYDRTDAGSGSDHVIIDLDGQFYESGGEAGSWGGGGGVQAISTPSAAYLSTFNTVLHPSGL